MNITVRIEYEMFANSCKQGGGENKFGSTRIRSYDHPHTNTALWTVPNKEWIDKIYSTKSLHGKVGIVIWTGDLLLRLIG
jgi:hypothetical protein